MQERGFCTILKFSNPSIPLGTLYLPSLPAFGML